MSAFANQLLNANPLDALLDGTAPGSEFDTFITLRGYRPTRGGMSNYVIRAVPYRNVLMESLRLANKLDPETIAADCRAASGDRELAARTLGVVRASLTRSLEQGGVDKRYTLVSPGLMRHRRTGALYVTGLVIRRQQVIHAFSKRSERSAESAVRRWIEARLPVGRWRQFKLERDNWSELRLGETVLRAEDDAPRPVEDTFDPYAYGYAKVSAEEGWRFSS